MPAQSIKVTPPKMLQGAASVAATAEEMATANPGAVPMPTAGSPIDGAWSGVAAAMGTQVSQMSTQVATKGPAVQAATSSGVTQFDQTDNQNSERFRELRGRVEPIDRTFKQEPQPGTPNDPGDPLPTQPLKPISTGQDVKDVLDQLKKGGNKGINELPNTADIRRLWDYLTRNATELPLDPRYGDGTGHQRMLPDGTIIGIRESKTVDLTSSPH